MTRGDRERLRAELAGKAMQGMLANPNVIGKCDRIGWVLINCEMGDIASLSTSWADALLAELDRTAEDPIKAGGTE